MRNSLHCRRVLSQRVSPDRPRPKPPSLKCPAPAKLAPQLPPPRSPACLHPPTNGVHPVSQPCPLLRLPACAASGPLRRNREPRNPT